MKSIVFKIVFLVLIFPSIGTAEGEPWRRVESMAFNKDSVGLSITEGDYIQDSRGPYFYELDTKAWSMKPIDDVQLKTKFNPKHAHVDEKKFEGAPGEIRTSNEDILKVKYTGCKEQGEGGPFCSGQDVSFGEKHFSLGRGGVSILSAEKFSKNFKEQVYPNLSSKERELYDQISAGKNPKPEIPQFLKRNY